MGGGVNGPVQESTRDHRFYNQQWKVRLQPNDDPHVGRKPKTRVNPCTVPFFRRHSPFQSYFMTVVVYGGPPNPHEEIRRCM